MRAGLDKPGALPLLAFIIFSLLTLVPSLSNFYNIKLADLSYYSRGARIPLLKDSTIDLAPEKHPVDHRQSWMLSAQYRPREGRPSRSRAGNSGAPTIPSEIIPVEIENTSRFSNAAAESSLLTRRARAFRTYFIQRLDDYQFFTSFSDKSLPVETMNFFPTPVSSDRSPPPTSIDHHYERLSLSTANDTTTSGPPSESETESPTPLHQMWQQACHTAIEFWELTTHSPYTYAINALIQSGKSYISPGSLFENPIAKHSSTSTQTNESSLPEKHSGSQTDTQDSSTPNDQPTDAAGRHTHELRGSCMAVVIGLVVGIMWF